MHLPHVLAAGLLALGAPAAAQYLDLTPAQDARIDSLVAAMTPEEKAGQMNQYTSFYDLTGPAPTEGDAAARLEQVRGGLVGSMLNVSGAAETRRIQEIALESRLGIPLIFGFDVIHGFETQFPVPLAEAATWDTTLIRTAAAWAAAEASAHGLHWTFAPMVDVSPDARWGRIVEGAGEDPFLGSAVARARVRGFQGASLADSATIAACAKHLAGYGYAGAGRDYNAVDVSEYTLHNDILPPFRAAAEAGSATFMNGFNTIAGRPVTADPSLQREWLKGELEWPGFIVSDWNSIGELVAHGVAADDAEAARLALLAGSDMDMETRAYVEAVPELLRSGAVDEGLVDDAVRRILRVKMALGLFDDPFRYCDPAREIGVAADPALLAAAIETAAASAVLLKNDDGALPLDPGGSESIVVIGDLATSTDYPLGTWSLAAERNSAVSLADAIKRSVADSSRVTVAEGPPTLTPGSRHDFLFELDVNTASTSGYAAAVAAAAEADVVVLALGEPGFMSGEARSRADLELPGLQRNLARGVIETNPNTVIVLYTGRPLVFHESTLAAPAMLCAWQPGSYGNLGIAQVLFGEHDADGKLPVSFPYEVGQEPLTYRRYSTGRPTTDEMAASEIVFHSHYMDAPTGARFPFGHGLSYTDFAVDGLAAAPLADRAGAFAVSATVRNTGDRAGEETVQLYVRDVTASRARPQRELKGFRQVTLEPGASEEVTFTLGEDELRFWTPEAGWHVEPGTFEVWVGTSSTELTGPVEIEVE